MQRRDDSTTAKAGGKRVKLLNAEEWNWKTCSNKHSYNVNGRTIWLHITAYYDARVGTIYYWAETFASLDEEGTKYIVAKKFKLELEGEGTFELINATGLRTPVTKNRFGGGTLKATSQATSPNLGPLSVDFPC